MLFDLMVALPSAGSVFEFWNVGECNQTHSREGVGSSTTPPRQRDLWPHEFALQEDGTGRLRRRMSNIAAA